MADQRFAWTIFWNFAVSLIGVGGEMPESKKCNGNVAAYGRRTLPQSVGVLPVYLVNNLHLLNEHRVAKHLP